MSTIRSWAFHLRTFPPSRLFLLAALVLGASRLVAQDRELHWQAMDVDARLDSAGRLFIRERQDMVFTGDWNGGERVFNVPLGQKFAFERLVRLDSAGREHPLHEGDLDEVDAYGWGPNHTLRWRSRLPSDPPFSQTLITYVLEFSYANVLEPADGGYVLNHDFAFADRVGAILQYTLRLRLDPAWSAPEDFRGTYGPVTLAPGSGFVVRHALRFQREGKPAGVTFGASALMRNVLAALFLVVVIGLMSGLWRREKALGRFNPLVPPSEIDERWLEDNVFAMRPEAVGAAWDENTAGPEVAAVLARLVSEKKLHSEVRSTGGFFKKDVMVLRLLVPRHELHGYERELIDALFESGSETTDTDAVKQRYRKTGFDPASQIKDGIDVLLRAQGRAAPGAPRPSRLVTTFLLVGAAALLVLGGMRNSRDGALAAIGAGISLATILFAGVAAFAWRQRVQGLVPGMLWFLVPLGIYSLALLATLNDPPGRAGSLTLAGLVALALAVWNFVLNTARARQSADYIAKRQRLCAGREYFRNELRQEQPRLRDEWFPWFIAFGLGDNMDKWFRSFGGERSRSSSTSSTWGSSGGSSSSSPSWTGMGGGGGFSGGGSSGSWAAAAGVMAAGVSAPSSSSSSGGSSGGGSSGGGGGGCW